MRRLPTLCKQVKSLAWRCKACGRIHLTLEPQAPPAQCVDCDAIEFISIAPSSDARRTYREVAEGMLPAPIGEPRARRRKASRRR